MTIFKKTKKGNYFGYYNGHYIFTYLRPHGHWACRIGKKGKWIFHEGYHTTYLKTLAKTERWINSKIK